MERTDANALLAVGELRCNTCHAIAYPVDAASLGDLILASWPGICMHHPEPRVQVVDPQRLGRFDDADRCLALANVVLTGARVRALRRTGRMAAEMYAAVDIDEGGLYADIVSPVMSLPPEHPTARSRPRPYGLFHEMRHTRDRRPHRSLKPALRDVRKILSGP